MSETSPMPKPQKSGSRWLWVLLAMLFVVPVIMFVGLVGLYVLRSQVVFHDYASREAQRAVEVRMLQDAVRVPAAQSSPPLPAIGDVPKKQAQIVRVQLDFEDFETRYANAIAVDYENQRSRLMVPSEVFASISGKINGRIVTRTAGSPKLVDVSGDNLSGGGMGVPGMPGMAAGGTSMGPPMGVAFHVVQEFPDLGLTELVLNNFDLTPVRVVGDFPVASIGDKLTVVSLPAVSGTLRELTVLGVDESVQLGDGRKLDHLLKLTEWTGATGALVSNSTGDPIAQIVFTKPGKLRYSYAVPMDRIFQAIYDQRQQGQALPVQPESFPGPDSRPPLVGELREDEPSRVPKVASELPQDPLTSSSPSLRLDDSPAPTILPQATETSPADASLPEFSPDRERQVYRVLGSATDMADTIRSLYGDVAKIAVDSGSRSVIAIAPTTVQDKIATMIKELNTRAQNVQDEQAKQWELARERDRSQSLQAEARQNEINAKAAMEEVSNRKQPKRTRLIKVTGRDPQEVAKVLTTLFGQTADVAVDERTGSVLITINRATTSGEVQFLLTEIEATATRLMEDASVATTSPKMTEQNRFNPAEMIDHSISPRRSREQLHAEQDREAKKLALQLRAAAPSDQAALRATLERLTEQQFQARQDQRKKEIDDLGHRIDQLRVTHLRRQQNQAEIIRRRIEELLDPNNDLHWEQSQNNTGSTTEGPAIVAAGKAVETTTNEETVKGTAERTFDGIPYSQWRTMLQTERKPAKLASAMEACSRLAVGEDTHRIAREIILMAGLFELGDSDDRDAVWSAANNALVRLPADAVVDELLASLSLLESIKQGRTFQGRFILIASHERAIDWVRGQEAIAALVKAVQTNGKDRNCLLAAACRIWENSEHDLQDFDGLQSLVMQRIDSAADTKSSLDGDWYTVAHALVAKNPETPDLALKLEKLARSSAREDDFVGVMNLVGQLGRHAEPVVPIIIEQILAELKDLQERENDKSRATNQDQSDRTSYLVRILGDIGVGSQAGTLLKELNLIASLPSPSREMRAIFEEARSAIVRFADIPDADAPPILSDALLVRGYWQIKSVNGKDQPQFQASINHNEFYWAHKNGGIIDYLSTKIDDHETGERLKLDPTKSPKEAVFQLKSDSKRHGIYELTESTLKIYVAPADQPKPAEMIKDASSVPDGYLLIELRRSLSMPRRR